MFKALSDSAVKNAKERKSEGGSDDLSNFSPLQLEANRQRHNTETIRIG